MGDFTIAGGELKFNAIPDYETPADTGTDNVYNVTVKVTDDEATPLSATKAVEVTVTNVNEAPTITTTTTSETFADNQPVSTAVETFAASDVDASTTFAWSVESGDDGGKLDIDSSTGALTFKTSPNFEMPVQSGSTANEYKVTVKVTDNGAPEMSDTHVLNVNVTNVNEPPVISSTMATHTAPSVMEIEFDIADADLFATAKDVVAYAASDPDAGAALTWTVSGTDAAHFSIDSTGKLSFDIRPNFEVSADTFTSPDTEGDNAYEIVVEVSDGLDDSGMTENPAVVDASLPVTVTVDNVD